MIVDDIIVKGDAVFLGNVSSVTVDESITVGGTNIIANSKSLKDWTVDYQGTSTSSNTVLTPTEINLNGVRAIGMSIATTGSTDGSSGIVYTSKDTSLVKGNKYIVSAWYYIDADTTIDNSLQMLIKLFNGETAAGSYNSIVSIDDVTCGEWHRIVCKFPVDVEVDSVVIELMLTGNGTVLYMLPKMEIGSTVTDWSPSPNDSASSNTYIGGTNLIRHSDTFSEAIDSDTYSRWIYVTTTNPDYKSVVDCNVHGIACKGFKLTNTALTGTVLNCAYYYGYPERETLSHKGEKYTASIYYYADSSTPVGKYLHISIAERDNASFKVSTIKQIDAADVVYDKWTRISISMTVESDTSTYLQVIPLLMGLGVVTFALPKLEMGEYATDWSPFPSEKANVEHTHAISDVTGLQSMQIGGTNLLDSNLVSWSCNVSAIKRMRGDYVSVVPTTSAVSGIYRDYADSVNTKADYYTFSCKLRADANRSIVIGIGDKGSIINITTDWQMYSVTGTYAEVMNATYKCCYVYSGSDTDVTPFSVKNPRMEIGILALDCRDTKTMGVTIPYEISSGQSGKWVKLFRVPITDSYVSYNIFFILSDTTQTYNSALVNLGMRSLANNATWSVTLSATRFNNTGHMSYGSYHFKALRQTASNDLELYMQIHSADYSQCSLNILTEDSRHSCRAIFDHIGQVYTTSYTGLEYLTELPAGTSWDATSISSLNRQITTLDMVNDPNLESGIYSVENVPMTFPTPGNLCYYYTLIVNERQGTDNSGWGTQLAILEEGGCMHGVYYRNANAGVWQPWRAVNAPNIIDYAFDADNLSDGIYSIRTTSGTNMPTANLGTLISDVSGTDAHQIFTPDTNTNMHTYKRYKTPATGTWSAWNKGSSGAADSANYAQGMYPNGYLLAGSAIIANTFVGGIDGAYNSLVAGTTFDISYPVFFTTYDRIVGSYLIYTWEVNSNININTYYNILSDIGKEVYLKGTLDGNIFTVAASDFLTCTQPTTEDGYVYMSLGVGGGTSKLNTNMMLTSDHPIFMFMDGKFQLYGSGGGSSTKVLEEDVTIYVNTSTGNDTTGQGTSAAPYATMQIALSKIPHDLNGHNATIIFAVNTAVTGPVTIDSYRNGKLIITTANNTNTIVSFAGKLTISHCDHVHFNGYIWLFNNTYEIADDSDFSGLYLPEGTTEGFRCLIKNSLVEFTGRVTVCNSSPAANGFLITKNSSVKFAGLTLDNIYPLVGLYVMDFSKVITDSIYMDLVSASSMSFPSVGAISDSTLIYTTAYYSLDGAAAVELTASNGFGLAYYNSEIIGPYGARHAQANQSTTPDYTSYKLRNIAFGTTSTPVSDANYGGNGAIYFYYT